MSLLPREPACLMIRPLSPSPPPKGNFLRRLPQLGGGIVCRAGTIVCSTYTSFLRVPHMYRQRKTRTRSERERSREREKKNWFIWYISFLFYLFTYYYAVEDRQTDRLRSMLLSAAVCSRTSKLFPIGTHATLWDGWGEKMCEVRAGGKGKAKMPSSHTHGRLAEH